MKNKSVLITIVLSCFSFTLMAESNTKSYLINECREETDSVSHKTKKNRILIDAGMAHWNSDNFRTAVLGTDMGFGLTVNPGVKWLHTYARFDYSKIRTTTGDTILYKYNGRNINFIALGLGPCKEFYNKNQTLIVNYTGSVVMVNIENESPVFGIGGGFAFNYLIPLPRFNNFSLGISVTIMSRTYNISDYKTSFKDWVTPEKEYIDRDSNLIFGVVAAF